MTNNDFVNYLLELLSPLGDVSAQKMFGGYGFFRAGLMFGLMDDDTFYLKVDEDTKAEFTARGLEPFVYMRGDKQMQMSYYRAPDEALDDSDEMRLWAEQAFQAALRAQKPKGKRISRKK